MSSTGCSSTRGYRRLVRRCLTFAATTGTNDPAQMPPACPAESHASCRMPTATEAANLTIRRASRRDSRTITFCLCSGKRNNPPDEPAAFANCQSCRQTPPFHSALACMPTSPERNRGLRKRRPGHESDPFPDAHRGIGANACSVDVTGLPSESLVIPNAIGGNWAGRQYHGVRQAAMSSSRVPRSTAFFPSQLSIQCDAPLVRFPLLQVRGESALTARDRDSDIVRPEEAAKGISARRVGGS